MTENRDPEKVVREIKRKTRRTVQVAVPVQPPEAALAHLRLHRLEVLRIEIEGASLLSVENKLQSLNLFVHIILTLHGLLSQPGIQGP